jgi:hypothetical protein
VSSRSNGSVGFVKSGDINKLRKHGYPRTSPCADDSAQGPRAPPYIPELNMTEILWERAKCHWREFVTWKKKTLHNKVRKSLDGYGAKLLSRNRN